MRGRDRCASGDDSFIQKKQTEEEPQRLMCATILFYFLKRQTTEKSSVIVTHVSLKMQPTQHQRGGVTEERNNLSIHQEMGSYRYSSRHVLKYSKVLSFLLT
jgi:hypothetical protein